MNLPSLLKFEAMVKPGGVLLLNTSIIDRRSTRGDIAVYEVPVSDIARELGNARVANMVMLGAAVRSTGVVTQPTIEKVMREKAFTGKKADMIPLNIEAFEYFKV
jgi:2-oxoglutarate ferredoxin oxidoreductase subunit gamma